MAGLSLWTVAVTLTRRTSRGRRCASGRCWLRHVTLNLGTGWQGMDFTTDKLRSMVRKWQTLIEAHVDVKTTDGYLLRMFCIAFTKKRQQQVKKTCYAQSSQIRQIRKKMVELMTREAAACDLKELVGKFIPEAIGAPLANLPQT